MHNWRWSKRHSGAEWKIHAAPCERQTASAVHTRSTVHKIKVPPTPTACAVPHGCARGGTEYLEESECPAVEDPTGHGSGHPDRAGSLGRVVAPRDSKAVEPTQAAATHGTKR